MAVSVILQAILRANVSQFVQALGQAGQSVAGLQQAAAAIQGAFDTFLIEKFLEILLRINTAVFEFAAKAVEAAGEWESFKYSMASVVLASNDITDATGKSLSETEKYNRSLALSGELMKQMRLDAAINVGTTKDLVGAYIGLANAVSNTSKKGDDAVGKTRKLSNALVSASYILGKAVLKGGTDQAVRETNELLEGRLTRINTFARALGIINDRQGYKNAVKEGRVYDYLLEKLKAYRIAQDKIARTYEGLKSTLEDIGDLSMQTIGQLLFDKAKNTFGDMVDTFFTQGKDGALALNKSFLDLLDTLSLILDKAVSPALELVKDVFDTILVNKTQIVSWLHVLGDAFGLIWDILKLIYDVMRLVFQTMGVQLKTAADGTDWVLTGLREIVQILDNMVNWITEKLEPALKSAYQAYDTYIGPIIEKIREGLGYHQDLTKKKAEDDKQAAEAAKTHATAIGGVNDALDENSKKVKDNTQHWKNWISTLQTAFRNRAPELASSFLTSFGNGNLGPSSAGSKGQYTINLVGPNGRSAVIQSQMTPQEVSQFHSQVQTFSTSMQRARQTMNLNPAGRNGPINQ